MHSPGLPGQIPALPLSRREPAAQSDGVDSFTQSRPELPIPYSPQPAGDSIRVIENEWRVGETETSYLISTGGCGAVKIFVQGESSSYCIVFHSFGDGESKDAGSRLGNYIARQKQRPQSVRVLCLQPYDISRDVMNSVYEIRKATEGAGIPTEVRTIRLNNIEHESYSEFIQLDMAGSEQQILERYGDLVLKDRLLSKADRTQKIELFQSLPGKHRTPQFLKKWSSLSLEEARVVVEEVRNGEKSWSERLFSHFPFFGAVAPNGLS